MEANKVYSMFTRSGKPEEIKPIGELPIGTKILAFGAGMSESVYCITGPKNINNSQEMCLVSNYYEGAYFSAPRTQFDEYSRSLSAKFGIGFYWDDVEKVVYPESTVKAAIRRADYLEKKIAAKKAAIAEADRKDIESLPARYPHLNPINPKEDRYKQLRANIVADLKHNFPNAKFSIKKRNYDCIVIRWVDGPALEKVKLLTSMYKDHVTDFTGDFRDYEPSNFNCVFGGVNYIFEERDYSFDLDKLASELAERANYEKREAHRDLYAILKKTSIPANASNFSITTSGIKCGSIYDFYIISFDVPETPQATQKTVHEVSGVEITNYSEKSFVVYGDTKPIKETLKELGGKFNMYLRKENNVFAGWIFPLTKKEAVCSALGL